MRIIIFECLSDQFFLPPSPFIPHAQVGADSATAQHYLCNTSKISYGLYVYKGVLLLAGCVLSFLTRNADPEFAESRVLMAVIYNSTVVCLAVLLIVYAGHVSVTIQIFAQSFGVMWCSVGNSTLLLGPRFWALFTLGDDQAMEKAANVHDGTHKGSRHKTTKQSRTLQSASDKHSSNNSSEHSGLDPKGLPVSVATDWVPQTDAANVQVEMSSGQP